MKSAPQHRRDHDGADLRFNLHRLIMADADLSPTAKNCASVLLFGFMSGKTGRCNPSYEEIAEALGISRETAMRGVKALAAAVYVTVHHTFRTVAGARVHGNNVFGFAFDRLGRHAPNAVWVAEGGGVNSDTTPGDNFDTRMVSDSTPGVVSELTPHEQRRENKEVEQDSPGLFGDGGLPEAPSFDFESWFEQWWLQYPRKTKKATAEKLAKAVIEGRRSDGFKATPAELMAGVVRYAASDNVRRGFIMSPVTWFAGACWLDEHAGRPFGGGRASASSEAVWATIDEMATRNKRSVG